MNRCPAAESGPLVRALELSAARTEGRGDTSPSLPYLSDSFRRELIKLRCVTNSGHVRTSLRRTTTQTHKQPTGCIQSDMETEGTVCLLRECQPALAVLA